MNDTHTFYRNKIIHGAYVYVLKPIFFLVDPEIMHDSMTYFGKLLGKYKLTQKITSKLFDYKNPALKQKLLGISFENPIGLSAGFDKDALLTDILPCVGFGFAEIGSVTGEKCDGNSKPRLWRLAKSKSLIVYYGLKNEGCEAVSERMKKKKFTIPIGASVAMTNCKENLNLDNAIKDFAKAFKVMEKVAAYITVNISCPNAMNGEPFIEPNKFDRLFNVLDKIPTKKPIFIKLSPDLEHSELDALLQVAHKHRIHGIVCTNLTKKRNNPKIIDAKVYSVGGMSGKVVQELSDKMLAYIYKKEGKKFILVGCGGVFTAEDAYKKIRLGASLVQLITGMIYEGPQTISAINQGLAKLLKKDGFTNISQAIGADNK